MTLTNSDAINILKKIRVNPFYFDEQHYRVDLEQLKESVDEMKSMTQSLVTINSNEHNRLKNEFITYLDRFIDLMGELRVSEYDFQQYQDYKKLSPQIERYQALILSVKLKLIPVLVNGQTFNKKPRMHTRELTKQTVLNKNNPFADITIKNQQYLYSDGQQFQTLAFTTGHTLTKLQTQDDKVALALQPGFKISKTVERKSINESKSITIDDTLSTPLADLDNERELFYI